MSKILSVFAGVALALLASAFGAVFVLWLATPPPREETDEEWEARQW